MLAQASKETEQPALNSDGAFQGSGTGTLASLNMSLFPLSYRAGLLACFPGQATSKQAKQLDLCFRLREKSARLGAVEKQQATGRCQLFSLARLDRVGSSKQRDGATGSQL